MKYSYLIIILFLIILSGCNSRPERVSSTYAETSIIIWDPENYFQSSALSETTTILREFFPDTLILNQNLSANTIGAIEERFNSVPKDSLCVFIIISARNLFQISSEWNLWMPGLWRKLDCKGKILIADAPWGDEFLNPIKTEKADTVWAINGRLGHLRKKLPKSMLAASCRFDETNVLSRGIDGENKTPLFTWYFIDALCKQASEQPDGIDLVSITELAARLTASARSRGVVRDIEEILFFNNSEIQKEEFKSFPNPVIWNGLADKVILKEQG